MNVLGASRIGVVTLKQRGRAVPSSIAWAQSGRTRSSSRSVR